VGVVNPKMGSNFNLESVVTYNTIQYSFIQLGQVRIKGGGDCLELENTGTR